MSPGPGKTPGAGGAGGGPRKGPFGAKRQARDGPPRPGIRKPPLRPMTTTLWEYPSQHYDGPTGKLQGDPRYVGATPSWVIWQLLNRFTREGEVVLDPMCGSGTTLDVCRDLGRRGLGFDLVPRRADVTRGEASDLPLEHESVDFVFMDPPYSTHVNYSDDAACIGKLDAGAPPEEEGERMGEAYYLAMEDVICEMHRVLRPGRFLGLYVSDSYRHRKGGPGVFMPIGFELFTILRDYFTPVDIVAVVRHNAKLQRGNWHQAADEGRFMMRGFNYLFIMFKEPLPNGSRQGGDGATKR